jgi:hypothetical protein
MFVEKYLESGRSKDAEVHPIFAATTTQLKPLKEDLMGNQFDARMLVVDLVIDQRGIVRNPEKARLMAEEGEHRDYLKLYESYRKSPKHCGAAHPELTARHYPILRKLSEQNVPSEYILRYAELRAEACGEAYDFAQRCKRYDADALWNLKDSLCLAVDSGLLLRYVSEHEKVEYERSPENVNRSLRLFADMLKFEAVQNELMP